VATAVVPIVVPAPGRFSRNLGDDNARHHVDLPTASATPDRLTVLLDALEARHFFEIAPVVRAIGHRGGDEAAWPRSILLPQ
jgi:hypothetical protein